jgi:phospholipase D1/2
MMIVDDFNIIVGSANINDRSMNGDRDSELALVTKDRDLVQVPINGKNVPVGRSIYELRAKLWKEHFGITDARELDPLS